LRPTGPRQRLLPGATAPSPPARGQSPDITPGGCHRLCPRKSAGRRSLAYVEGSVPRPFDGRRADRPEGHLPGSLAVDTSPAPGHGSGTRTTPPASAPALSGPALRSSLPPPCFCVRLFCAGPPGPRDGLGSHARAGSPAVCLPPTPCIPARSRRPQHGAIWRPSLRLGGARLLRGHPVPGRWGRRPVTGPPYVLCPVSASRQPPRPCPGPASLIGFREPSGSLGRGVPRRLLCLPFGAVHSPPGKAFVVRRCTLDHASGFESCPKG